MDTVEGRVNVEGPGGEEGEEEDTLAIGTRDGARGRPVHVLLWPWCPLRAHQASTPDPSQSFKCRHRVQFHQAREEIAELAELSDVLLVGSFESGLHSAPRRGKDVVVYLSPNLWESEMNLVPSVLNKLVARVRRSVLESGSSNLPCALVDKVGEQAEPSLSLSVSAVHLGILTTRARRPVCEVRRALGNVHGRQSSCLRRHAIWWQEIYVHSKLLGLAIQR